MKLLKLDARFEDARRVARCLVGSADVDGLKLIAVLSRVFVLENDDISVDPFETYHSIKIPIDTIELCPFTAMREGVEVFHQETNQCGLIESIICGREVWLTQEGDESSIPFGVNDLKLGLYQIERGELDGCEIVEVGE